jgi:hypothetical protein
MFDKIKKVLRFTDEDSSVKEILPRLSKYIKKVFITKSGKRKTKTFLRPNKEREKTFLEKSHFGTFSPCKGLAYNHRRFVKRFDKKAA